MMPKIDLAERARKLDPWLYEFEIDGQSFGGDKPRETRKTKVFGEFISLLGLEIGTVLELGSHEGSHTLQLAEIPGVTRVVGLEGRPENIARANFAKEAFGVSNVEFHQADLDDFDVDAWPQFDAVFCSGLLYHLEHPWEFIAKIARISRHYALIDTHYTESAETEIGDFAGIWHEEITTHPSSGLADQAFYMTFRDLMMVMMHNGLLVHRVIDATHHPNGPRALFLATRSGLVDAWPSGGWNQNASTA